MIDDFITLNNDRRSKESIRNFGVDLSENLRFVIMLGMLKGVPVVWLIPFYTSIQRVTFYSRSFVLEIFLRRAM